MQYRILDDKQNFFYAFDTESGAYIRSGILDAKGKDSGIDPFMASFPHLIDVGVMGHCAHGKTGLCTKAGIGCYQSGPLIEAPNMTVENFRWIAEQCRGRTNQLALGGRGDPDQHEHFEELLQISRENMLVPNFTTSGYGMAPDIAKLCKQYCGAVAVSWYRNAATFEAIRILVAAGVKTNIHYVLGNNSIDEAISRLEHNDFPQGINAIIFLLHKPTGLGQADNVLEISDARIVRFLNKSTLIIPSKLEWIVAWSPAQCDAVRIQCPKAWTPVRAGVSAATLDQTWLWYLVASIQAGVLR